MRKNKIICLLLILIIYANLQAQTNEHNKKAIEVTGSATMTVPPDEIELQIVLLEYNKNGNKVRLDKVQSDFYEVLRKNNINPQIITLDNANSSYWWYWWTYRDVPYQTRTINLKLTKETNFLKLVEDLNEKWVQSITISKTTNKDIQKYRKQVKIEAIKAAKEKATYLLESIDARLGNVISVVEIPEGNNYGYHSNNLLDNFNVSMGTKSNSNAVENVEAIKLRYEIKVSFEIN